MHFNLASDDLPVGVCLSQEQLLGQAVEDLADVLRAAAVEAEGELVEISLKVFGADVALMPSAVASDTPRTPRPWRTAG